MLELCRILHGSSEFNASMTAERYFWRHAERWTWFLPMRPAKYITIVSLYAPLTRGKHNNGVQGYLAAARCYSVKRDFLLLWGFVSKLHHYSSVICAAGDADNMHDWNCLSSPGPAQIQPCYHMLHHALALQPSSMVMCHTGYFAISFVGTHSLIRLLC